MNGTKMKLGPLVAVSLGLLLVVGCKKKEEPAIPDAAVVAVVPDAAPLVIDTVDDAGFDAGIDAALPAHHGPAVNQNTAKIKACCNALRGQAKTMGSSPEANIVLGVAAQCDAVAAQAGSAGTAPELAAIRNMMKGKTLPTICQ